MQYCNEVGNCSVVDNMTSTVDLLGELGALCVVCISEALDASFLNMSSPVE